MKEIKSTAPTPQDWIELAKRVELAERLIEEAGLTAAYKDGLKQLENKTND